MTDLSELKLSSFVYCSAALAFTLFVDLAEVTMDYKRTLALQSHHAMGKLDVEIG